MEGCRLADASDVGRISEMARALREEIGDIRGGPLWAQREGLAEPLEEHYEQLLSRDNARVVVGTIDDVVIGFGVGVLDRLHSGDTLGVMTDLYVEPEAREIGVGEEIANTLLAWFDESGCIGVDAWALPGHRMTKNFFEDQGFVSRGIVVHRNLSDKPLESDNDEV